jgi:hypothetical protein
LATHNDIEVADCRRCALVAIATCKDRKRSGVQSQRFLLATQLREHHLLVIADENCAGSSPSGKCTPKLYGGTERVVAWLADELVNLGHEVSLFASGDSVTGADLIPICPRALRLGRPRTDPMAIQATLIEEDRLQGE